MAKDGSNSGGSSSTNTTTGSNPDASGSLTATPSSSGSSASGTAARRAAARSKPYDPNNSFVKKVATKVSDLIPQNSWISKWFNSSQDEEGLQNAGAINSECENYEDKQSQPPLKRARIRMDVTHPPGTFTIKPRERKSGEVESTKEHFSNHNETTQDFLEPPAGGSYNKVPRFVSSTPAFSMNTNKMPESKSALNVLMTEQNNGATNGTDDNSESSESTSGCSSLIPQTNRQDGPPFVNYNSPFGKRRYNDDKFSFTNFLQSPRSLLLDATSRDTLASRRPSFNPSLVNNSPLERSSSLSSPFYRGNTMFGGANAASIYRSNSVLSEPSQLRPPPRTSVEVNPSSNESSNADNSGMSTTARRILETIEQFSSPLTDARKIPVRDVMGGSSSSNSSILSASSPHLSRKRQREDESARVGLRHLTRELVVPTVPDMLRLRRRQKLQTTTMNARKIMSARSVPSTSTASQGYHMPTIESSKRNQRFDNQLKAKKKMNLEEQETVEAVNLPSMPLPISSLPRFDISLPQNPKPTTQDSPQTPKFNKEDSFKFASPIKLTNVNKNLESFNNNFTFSKPMSPSKASSVLNDSSELSKTLSIGSNNSMDNTASFPNFVWTGPSQTLKPKEKSQPKEEASGLKVASELKSGSVMDFFAKKTIDNSGSSDVWECNDCLIKNSGKINNCISCKSPRSIILDDDDDEDDVVCLDDDEKPSQQDDKFPKTSTTIFGSNVTPSSNIFGKFDSIKSSPFNSTASSSPFEKTKSETSISASSSNGSKPSTNLPATSTTTTSLNAFKPAKSSWECPCCMVYNDDTVTTCVACNTAKPGSIGKSPKLLVESSSLVTATPLTTTSTTGFGDKFKKPEGTWTCDTCMIQNKPETVKCAACETPKPGANKSSGEGSKLTITSSFGTTSGFGDKFKKAEGSWSCDSCMLSNKPDATKCIACETPKPGSSAPTTQPSAPKLQFKIDMPANASSFKFGIDKANDESTKSSAASIPKANGFTFGSNSQTPVTTGFSFGVPSAVSDKDKQPEANDKNNDIAKVSSGGFAFKPSCESVTAVATFQFGAKSVEKSSEENKSTTSATFSFGAPTKPETKMPNAGFVFGSPVVSDEKKDEKKDEPKPASTTGFSFGTPATTNKDTSSDNKPSSDTPTSGGFMFGSPKPAFNFQSKVKEPPKPTVVEPQKQEPTMAEPVKATTAGFSFGTNTASSSLFSFTASKPTETPTPATTTTNSSLPAFGSSGAPKPVFSFGKPAEATSPTAATIPPQQTENKAPVLTFGSPAPSATGSTFGQTTTPSTSLFGNLNPAPTSTPTAASTENKPIVFGAPENKSTSIFGEPNAKLPAFGASSDNKPSPATSSIFGAPSAAAGSNNTTSPFGSSSSVFGSGTTQGFGTNATSSIFGSTKPAETTTPAATPSLFSFGQSSAPQTSTPATGGFNFNAGSNATTGSGSDQKNIFSFGASSGSNNQIGNGFGGSSSFSTTPAAAPNFTFNAPKPEATATATSAFGQPAANTTTPMFNAPSAQPSTTPMPAFGAGTANSAPATGGFNFGNASVPNSFSFGSSSAPSTGGFNFNAPSNSNAPPTFSPNVTPSFNFTAGSAPTAFNAPPASTRKIKKAVRRMPRQ